MQFQFFHLVIVSLVALAYSGIRLFQPSAQMAALAFAIFKPVGLLAAWTSHSVSFVAALGFSSEKPCD
jgi:hypothetical protein